MIHTVVPAPDRDPATARPTRPRSLAFYLPQYHPIAENDAWWGPGFTDWVNVVQAAPRFAGHLQPHLPGELGFYDLRLEETRQAQADLADAHGIDGFCIYHYWFGGRRLLQRPVEDMLRTGRPDFPFCLCWANEPWTRRWNGASGEVLIDQRYSTQDDLEHIRSLLPALGDRRYIHHEGRPLLLVFHAPHLPDPRKTAETWRDEAVRAGLPEPFICGVESFPDHRVDPVLLGFDAAVEFQPDWAGLNGGSAQRAAKRAVQRLGIDRLAGRVQPSYARFDYREVVQQMLAKPPAPYQRFPCVTPGWDNSARRDRGAVVLAGSTPEEYGRWLEGVLHRTPDTPFIFVNAWNEWAEGCHLEPCRRWGRAYLEEHRRVIRTRQRL
jgi:lipopolysaccharide biosynthesis protein